MNTKIIIAVTVAALSLATTAFAADTGSQQYPAPNPALSFAPQGDPVLMENGQNRPVETANSLPRGFENGTADYRDAQSVNQWFAQQADHRFAQAHPASSPRG